MYIYYARTSSPSISSREKNACALSESPQDTSVRCPSQPPNRDAFTGRNWQWRGVQAQESASLR